jgi:hypothetical protein
MGIGSVTAGPRALSEPIAVRKGIKLTLKRAFFFLMAKVARWLRYQ